MQKLVNRQAVLYEWSRFESQWSMSALLAPSGGGEICFGHRIRLKMMELHPMIKGTKSCSKQLNGRSLTD